MKLGEIAKRLDCSLEGDPAIEIQGVASIELAQAGQLTFVASPKYRKAARTTRASAMLYGLEGTVEREAGMPPVALLRSANPYVDFARALELLHTPPRYAPGIHPTATIAPTAKIGEGAHVGPYCFVDDGVEIGRNAVLHSFVTVYRHAKIGDDFFAHSHVVIREGCRIGNRVLLQNGVVIGADGFGFAPRADGRYHKIPQTGIVTVGDDVEIQANSCVDRSTMGETRIERGVKIDDLVLVGHGSHVGEDSVLCGQVGMAGGTEIGKHVTLAGQVGCAGHLTVGDGAVVSAQSGVPNDLAPKGFYSGYPAMENREWLKCVAAFNRLPELVKTVRQLEAEIARLTAQKVG